MVVKRGGRESPARRSWLLVYRGDKEQSLPDAAEQKSNDGGARRTGLGYPIEKPQQSIVQLSMKTAIYFQANWLVAM